MSERLMFVVMLLNLLIGLLLNPNAWKFVTRVTVVAAGPLLLLVPSQILAASSPLMPSVLFTQNSTWLAAIRLIKGATAAISR